MLTMTRQEYERTYGVAPVLPAASKIDTTPAPVRMTREQYVQEFGVTPEGKKINNPVKNVMDQKAAFPANTGTSNPLGNIARTFANIPSSAINLGRAAISPINPLEMASNEPKPFSLNIGKNIAESAGATADIVKNRGIQQGAKDILGGFADTYLKAGEALYGGLDKAYNALLDDPKKALADVATHVAKAGVEDPLLIPSLLYGGQMVGKKDLIAKAASPITRGVDTSIPNIMNKTGEAAHAATKGIQERVATRNVEKTADEIYSVEQNYAKGRKTNEYATDNGSESRKRIADSGVLKQATNSDGLIQTKGPGGAVENYRALTVDGYEDVVRKGLEREGATAHLNEVKNALIYEIDHSGIEGADLVAALKGAEKEIQGLAQRADELGNIPLAKVHDAKISTTKNIDYNTPAETKTYRKAVARAYKNLVEKKSSLNIGEVNRELGKYYEDISRLEAMDGRRVKGGKLGKYTAQISGNVAGGIAGGVVGGIPGAAIGTVVGGEISGMLKGAELSSSFGRVAEGKIPHSQILTDAKAAAELPPEKDLSVADKRVGAPKHIEKTPEVHALEGKISRNVKAQEAAIKAKDFTLVESLKQVYEVLVAKLKELVKELHQTTRNPRGFIRIGGAPKDEARSLPKSSGKSSLDGTVSDTGRKSTPFEGFSDLSTSLLEKLKGRSTVSKQFISDLTNAPDLKQTEKDLIRTHLDGEADTVHVPSFAEKVRADLLPLERSSADKAPGGRAKIVETTRYENVNLPEELRGPVANYSEHIYQSPVKTSAGGVHFSGMNEPDRYFGHTRVEDLPGTGEKGRMIPPRNMSAEGRAAFDKRAAELAATGDTRRVIEVQSDLFQKGRLDLEDKMADLNSRKAQLGANVEGETDLTKRREELAKLEPYKNNAAHFRMIREEVKQAAIDGKTKLQFPTGETAMKIEGLGDNNLTWMEGGTGRYIQPEELKPGKKVVRGRAGEGPNEWWIITDVLGDGKFKAVQKDMGDFHAEDGVMQGFDDAGDEIDVPIPEEMKETFDISGKVDTENPIYKFYEKEVGKYLKSKYGAQLITDPQGVQWWEMDVKPEQGKLPIEAYGAAGVGAGAAMDDNT